ncbi:TsoY family (seleno)protein [Thiomicrorhabdus chilensis]|uniref:TsoY family (seleno)protein n=1 Tax=Thiomicrorhabdus chilensis TaxID=63656 RepID=UPI00040B2E34|nr:hypothetical protein [Thiomicrorhabdus chilensis]
MNTSITLQKWHPRHWLLPLGMMGTSIMLVFILNAFIPHKGHFLPSLTQFSTHLASVDGFVFWGLALAWYGFWTLFFLGSLMVPYFLYKSIQFLKASAHRLSDSNPMETAGWFGVSLSLAMYGNVSAFATIMFFELSAKADDLIWPFWLAYNTAIALMALVQYIWYRNLKTRLKRQGHVAAEQASMVVPFALAFMGLNLAGPGALGSHDDVVGLSLTLSLGFMALSMIVFLSKLSVFKRDAKALFTPLQNSKMSETERSDNWAQIINFGTAVTAFNVWLITSVRNYLNYGHHFSAFDFATKNMITWGAGLTVTLALIVLFTLWRRGFFGHLFQAQRPLIFSLGLICMLVSSYVITALFTLTALKIGLLSYDSVALYAIIGVETLLLTLNLFTVAALVYRMVLKGNIQCWHTDEVDRIVQGKAA